MQNYLDKFNTAWLSLGYNCNNKCIWCYASSNLKKNREKVLDSSREEGIVKLLSDLKVRQLLLIGGEPTLYLGLPNLIRKFSSKKIPTGLVTNGRKLKDRVFVKDLKHNGLRYLSASIEGYNEKSHGEITLVKKSFSETMRGIENSLSEGIRTSTNTTISKKNVNDLEKIINLLANYPLISITFNICGVCIGNPSNNNYTLSPREGVKAFERAYLYFKSKDTKTKLKLISPIPLCNVENNLLKELKEKEGVKGSCHILGGRNFVFDYNGDILPCTHFTGFPMFNVFSKNKIMSADKFIEEYNNPSGLGFKFRKRLSYYPSIKCGNEKCLDNCTGGCPVFWMKYNPEEEIKGIKDGN